MIPSSMTLAYATRCFAVFIPFISESTVKYKLANIFKEVG